MMMFLTLVEVSIASGAMKRPAMALEENSRESPKGRLCDSRMLHKAGVLARASEKRPGDKNQQTIRELSAI
jgi:hypothetical protein